MKKILLMAAAALTSLSMSATLYVTGGAVDGAPAAWDPAKPLEVELKDGSYTFSATGGFKISTAKGGWDSDFNPNAYQLAGSWSNNSASLTKGDKDIAAPGTGKWVYTVNADITTISAAQSTEVSKNFYKIHGNIVTGEWADIDLTENNGKWESAATTVKAGEFGIKIVNEAGAQLDWIGGAITISEANKVYTYAAGGNAKNTLAGSYKIVLDPAAKTIEFKGDGGDTPVVPPTPSAPELMLVGTINGWNPDDATYKMTADGNTYTISLPALEADAEFKVKTTEAGWAGDSWGAEGDPAATEAAPVAVTVGTPMNAWKGSGCNFKVTEALSNVTITFVYAAEGASTLTVTADGNTPVIPDPKAPELMLVGTINGWNPDDTTYKMDCDGNTYTISLPVLEADAEFKVKTTEAGWAGDSWGAEGDPSWTEAQPVAVTPNAPMNAWKGSGCNFKVTEALSNVVVTFVYVEGSDAPCTLTVAGTSAVEAIEAAEAAAPAEYFNLQGMRIMEPAAGQLYIVKRGNKVSKEIR